MSQRDLFPVPPPASEPPSSSGTRVVNLRREAFDVYIGRARGGKPPHLCKRGEEGRFGNPHPVKLCGPLALPFFRRYLRERLERDPAFREDVEGLRGKVLGCFCKTARGTGPCHGDVYVEWLETGSIVVDPPAPADEEPSL